MKDLIDSLNAHPKYVGLLGTVSGWASLDFLRTAQFAAAILASLVSACTLVLIIPKAWAQIKVWWWGVPPA